ncbi:OmpA family protein [Pseudomonas sp. 22526]|uniref:OmpA family protein n=1 Tax=Pseudomonas sp. 22526 TaxID=3453937 RepID=UPI003F82510D
MIFAATLFCCPPLLAQQPKTGEIPGKVFDHRYQELPPVGVDQVQVVYYRTTGGTQRVGAAHIYVDRQFHTGLLPGGYTRFCLAPGTHTLGAYLDDAPRYLGKSTDLYQASLLGGKTYYLRVREDGTTFPLPVKRDEAERELRETRAQVHALSRAETVEACRHYDYLDDDALYKDYTLSSDVLFAFGKAAYGDISAAGHRAIAQWLKELQRDDAQIRQVQVVGHTDPIGHEAENQLLGLQRATTVRQLLIDNGLPESIINATSAGSREPLVHSCYGSRTEQIPCYAPNRRVVLRVDLSRRSQ